MVQARDADDPEECLLHLAVQHDSSVIFEALLQYGRKIRSSNVWPNDLTFCYPWPSPSPIYEVAHRVCGECVSANPLLVHFFRVDVCRASSLQY